MTMAMAEELPGSVDFMGFPGLALSDGLRLARWQWLFLISFASLSNDELSTTNAFAPRSELKFKGLGQTWVVFPWTSEDKHC